VGLVLKLREGWWPGGGQSTGCPQCSSQIDAGCCQWFPGGVWDGFCTPESVASELKFKVKDYLLHPSVCSLRFMLLREQRTLPEEVEGPGQLEEGLQLGLDRKGPDKCRGRVCCS
jgi:hypothetical protein